jgi:spore coat protein U-like protein
MAKRRLVGLVALGALSQAMPQTAPMTGSAAFLQANHLAVTLVAQASCTTIATSPLAFPGTVSPGAAVQSLTATGTVTYQCSAGTAPVLGFDNGTHASSAASTVAVLKGPGASGTQSIAYSLYSDSAAQNLLPLVTGTSATTLSDITGGTTLSPASNAASHFVVYAISPTVGANIAPGTYTDTITATLYF